MSLDSSDQLERFHRVLVEEIRARRPKLLTGRFTVAEIYQDLVPYRTHRDRLGVEMNGDYEHLLLMLLAGEGDYLVLESEPVRKELRAELESATPDTALFRDFAAADVRLNPEHTPPPSEVGGTWESDGDGRSEEASEPSGSIPVESLAPAAAGRPEREEEMAQSEHVETSTEPVGAEGSEEEEGVEAEVETCRWCRAELPDRENLNFCPFCGTDVEVVPCPSCGEELEPSWRFCIACGTELADD